MKVEGIYGAVAINRTPQCMDWGNNDLICFGASHAIGIFDPSVSNFIIFLLHKTDFRLF